MGCQRVEFATWNVAFPRTLAASRVLPGFGILVRACCTRLKCRGCALLGNLPDVNYILSAAALGDWTAPSSMRISVSDFRDDSGYFTSTIEVLHNVFNRWGVHFQGRSKGINIHRGKGPFVRC